MNVAGRRWIDYNDCLFHDSVDYDERSGALLRADFVPSACFRIAAEGRSLPAKQAGNGGCVQAFDVLTTKLGKEKVCLFLAGFRPGSTLRMARRQVR